MSFSVKAGLGGKPWDMLLNGKVMKLVMVVMW
jgi:hypothetical protein